MEALQTTGLTAPNKSSELLTPLPGSVKEVSSPDDENTAELKRKLAFEEEQREDAKGRAKEELFAPEPEKEVPQEKPRSSRTSATKISPALLQKIENNISGVELKITALIPFDGLSMMCEALSRNTSTERLDLEGCGIGDRGCVLIRDLLIGNKVIKHVDLQMNQITDVGCRYLSEILPKNHTLQKLYLGYNDIKDDGVYALIAAMRPRGQLEIVVSGNTNVSDMALGRLDRALEQQWKPVSSASKQKKEVVLSADVNPYMDMFDDSSPKASNGSGNGSIKDKEKDSKAAKPGKSRAAEDDEPGQREAKRARTAEGGEKAERAAKDGEREGGEGVREREKSGVQSQEQGERKAAERAEKARERAAAAAQEKSEKREREAERKEREAERRKAERAMAKKAAAEKAAGRSPLAGAARGDAAAREEEAASSDEECGPEEAVYRGTPFRYTFTDSPNSSIWSEGAPPPDAFRALAGDEAQAQRTALAQKFNLQWRRLRVFCEDTLEQERRELGSIGQLPTPQNLFGKACKFVARQQGFGHRQYLNLSSGGGSDSSPPSKPQPPSPSERQRRRLVRQRVQALSLKLRHMAEDTVRDQRCEAQMLAILQGTLLPSQREVPAGYCAELGFVYVPCPFRLQLQVCRESGDGPAVSVV